MQPAHLVDDHSERIAVRLVGRWAVLIEQEFRAHPTNRPRSGSGGRGQGDCTEVNCDPHETKVCDARGAVVVDENVRLLGWSGTEKKGSETFDSTPLRSP